MLTIMACMMPSLNSLEKGLRPAVVLQVVFRISAKEIISAPVNSPSWSEIRHPGTPNAAQTQHFMMALTTDSHLLLGMMTPTVNLLCQSIMKSIGSLFMETTRSRVTTSLNLVALGRATIGMSGLFLGNQ
jgi:hypothetical protein